MIPRKLTKKYQYISKHHAQGNSFIIAQHEALKEVSVSQPGITSKMIQKICKSVEVDGFISVQASGKEIKFNLTNADGSPAEVSGNGLRCLGQALARKNKTSVEAYEVKPIENENVQYEIGVKEGTEAISQVVAKIGIPKVNPEMQQEKISKLSDSFAISNLKQMHFVDVGNPHLVLWLENLDSVRTDGQLQELGTSIMSATVENGLGKLNIEFVKINSDSEIQMKVFERGVGITQACGSGAVASIASLKENLSNNVAVLMDGGTANVSVDKAGIYSLGGDVYFVELLHEQK